MGRMSRISFPKMDSHRSSKSKPVGSPQMRSVLSTESTTLLFNKATLYWEVPTP
eukprot:CAMPEP_0197449848 /NCGR_PEP_ID=MMETSP1175-20131217/23216_1 /TAXON_ID=1003142 /ORGANISM="Triceratium dubium, Strain CCMP147" /LENGTH=53 /DNA_ID=CAMNT_0042982099 /DNA_START=34 /DNA_END=191 /DNA_ORIENTATION=-